MHGDLSLGGPVWWAFVGLILVTWILGVFVVGDSLRARRAARFDQLPESRLLYTIPQAVFIVSSVLAQAVSIRSLAIGVAVALPVMLAQQVVYLLRVVYPTRPDGSPASLASADAEPAE